MLFALKNGAPLYIIFIMTHTYIYWVQQILFETIYKYNKIRVYVK